LSKIWNTIKKVKGQTIGRKLDAGHFEFNYAVQDDCFKQSPAEQACPINDEFIHKNGFFVLKFP